MVASDEVEQSCEACQTNPVFRKGYGCDEPVRLPDGTTKIQVTIECPQCLGNKTGCDFCPKDEKGKPTGKITYDRCPRALARESGFSLRIVNFFVTAYQPHGHLPGPGGIGDQPAVIVQAIEHLMDVSAKLEKRRRKKDAT